MASLPIFFGDLQSSLKAAMIFPREPERARVCAAWLIMRGVSNMREMGFGDFIDPPKDELVDVACAAADFAYIYNDAQKNGADGSRSAIIVGCLWAMICEAQQTASWEGAIQAAEQYTVHHNKKLPASRSRFRECLSRFKPVLHLLGASLLRRRPGQAINGSDAIIDFAPDRPRKADLLAFVAEAKELQDKLLAWERARVQGSGMLDELFDLSSCPPTPQWLGWPDTARVKTVAIDPWIEIARGQRGRPRKIPS
jgi:hypothetical protein